jgi:hypothetical protein
MKKFHTVQLILVITAFFVPEYLYSQSYLGTSGGFEGDDIQVVNTQAFPTGGQAGKWTKANITQTIALQSTVTRSGMNALQVSNSSNVTLRRVYTPTFKAVAGQKLVMQYYRRVSSTSNTQESLAEISRNGSNTSTYTQAAASVPASANTWEKVVFSPATVIGADFTSTTWAAIQHRATGSGGDLYIDDVTVYAGTGEDIIPPNSVTGTAVMNDGADPASAINIIWNTPAGGIDGGGFMVVRYNVDPNADNDPNVNGIYAPGNVYNNGTGGLPGTIVYVGQETDITDVDLSYGTQYWYKIYTYDKAYNYSNEVEVTGTTIGKVYYSKPAGALNLLSTWGMNPDGSGTQPSTFSEDYQLFNAVNNPTPTINNTWILSQKGSRVIVGDGINPVNLTIPAAYEIQGIIDVKKSSTLTNANSELMLLGKLDTASTVHYNGTGPVDQNLSSGTYGNLVLSGSNTKVPSSDLTILGNLSITSNAVLNCDGYIVNLFGNWTVNNGGDYLPSQDIRTSVNFRGNGAHTLFTQGGENFMNVKVFEGGVVKLLSDITVDSTLWLQEGKLSIQSQTLSLNGSFVGSPTNAISGSKRSNLVAGDNYASGLIYLDQSADSSNYLNSLVNNAVIDTLTLGNKIRIAPNTIADGKSGLVKVGVGGVLEILDSLILVSDATGTARVGESAAAGNYIFGNITVQRYLPAKRSWHLLTAPVINSDVTVHSAWMEDHTFPTTLPAAEPIGFGTHITGGSAAYPDAASAEAVGFDYSASQGQTPSIRVFQGGNWNTTLPDGPSATLFPDYPAYLLFVRGDRKIDLNNPNAAPNTTTLRATGLIQTGDLSPNPVAAPFTLIGNPYPSPLDFEKIYNQTPGLQNKFWKWDARLATSGGHTLVQRTGTNAYITVPADLNSNNIDAQHIPSGNGFFVRPVTGTVNISIKESHKSDSLNTNTIAGSPNQNLYVSLYKAGATDSLADGVLATFGNGIDGIDNEDALKPTNFEENLALRRSAQSLMLEARPAITSKDTLFLNLTNKTERAYKFRLKGSNFSGGNVAYIIDTFLHTTTAVDLSGAITTYNFSVTAVAGSKNDNRFFIVFEYTAPLPVTLTSVKAYNKNSDIAVEWNVSNESSISRYEVEKSVDGARFTKAAAVTAINASTGKAQYSWLDVTPAQGYNYYRIRSVALNGEVKYSSVVRVSLNGGGKTGIVMYPNPVKGSTATLQLTNLEKGVYTASLYNQLGQKAFSKIITHGGGTASQTIDLGSLAAGIYQLQLTGDNGLKTTLQFSKQ